MPCRLPYNGGIVSCSSAAKRKRNGRIMSVWIVSYQRQTLSWKSLSINWGSAEQACQSARGHPVDVWLRVLHQQCAHLFFALRENHQEDPRCESVLVQERKALILKRCKTSERWWWVCTRWIVYSVISGNGELVIVCEPVTIVHYVCLYLHILHI